jgi:hypothetical protein
MGHGPRAKGQGLAKAQASGRGRRDLAVLVLLAAGCWLLAAGCWLLAAGCTGCRQTLADLRPPNHMPNQT